MHIALTNTFITAEDAIYADNAALAMNLLTTGMVTQITLSEAWCKKHDPEYSVVHFLNQRITNKELPVPSWNDSEQYQQSITRKSAKKIRKHAIACSLNFGDTFERFVCHSGNAAAYGFAQLASLSASKEKNPLLIIGPSKGGKSHLLNAIGLQYLRFENDAKILRIDASEFSSPNVQRENFTALDMLLIDNLETIISEPVAQNLVQFIGKKLRNRGSQTVLAMRTGSTKLPDLQKCLLQYFAQGVCVYCGPQNHNRL